MPSHNLSCHHGDCIGRPRKIKALSGKWIQGKTKVAFQKCIMAFSKKQINSVDNDKSQTSKIDMI